MEINLSATIDVTEYAVMPDKKNTLNIFSVNGKSLVISFCDEDENVIKQSEISIEDARTLAKMILL